MRLVENYRHWGMFFIFYVLRIGSHQLSYQHPWKIPCCLMRRCLPKKIFQRKTMGCYECPLFGMVANYTSPFICRVNMMASSSCCFVMSYPNTNQTLERHRTSGHWMFAFLKVNHMSKLGCGLKYVLCSYFEPCIFWWVRFWWEVGSRTILWYKSCNLPTIYTL